LSIDTTLLSLLFEEDDNDDDDDGKFTPLTGQLLLILYLKLNQERSIG
jgi:hypothetical protein